MVSDLERIFTGIHDSGVWNNNNPAIPRSGPGASVAETAPLMERLRALFSQYSIQSVTDIGCGDLAWTSMVTEFSSKSVRYHGIDLIKSLVSEHTSRYGHWGTFEHGDARVCDIPACDMVLCKDVFSHLDDEQIGDVLKNIARSDFKYLLVTTSDTATQQKEFSEPWHWRRVNLALPPHNLRVFTDKFTAGKLTCILLDKRQLSECLDLSPRLKSIDGNVVYYDGPYVREDHVALVQQEPKIPRILHMVYIGNKPVPFYVRDYRKKWEELMPNWKVRLWTNDDLNSEFPEAVLNKIRESHKGAQKADILRAFIVLKHGGAYFDADHEPLHSIEPLWKKLHFATAIGCHYEAFNSSYIANGFFAATPGHPWILSVCTDIMNQPLNTADVNWKTGPGAYARCLHSSLDVVIVPPSFFYPYHYRAKFQPWDRESSYSVHHWFHDW